ncbi:hypothetical protein JXQ31_20270 [candidate division KSB1 bacterium]|nr:hypothetical protein [candidate division KSB1 bacterium]
MVSILKNLEKINHLIHAGNYSEALKILESYSASGSDQIQILYLTGQCKLALGDYEGANHIYQNLLTVNEPDQLPLRAEAELVLGKNRAALLNFESCIKAQTPAGDVLFLTSIAAYKSGNILKAKVYLTRAFQSGFDWKDDIPVDFIADYVLLPVEFNDFEQIYLDISEEYEDGSPVSKNRWFAINIPIYEFFTAKDNYKEKAQVIIELISDASFLGLLDNGKQDLELIINGLAKSETDARFGLEAVKLFNNNDYDELAKIMLALFLEQINQSGAIFGLERDFIKSSQLQDLILLLPFKIAVLLMFLYAACHPVVQVQPAEKIKIDDNILAGLIAQCFLIFYKEIKNFNDFLS